MESLGRGGRGDGQGFEAPSESWTVNTEEITVHRDRGTFLPHTLVSRTSTQIRIRTTSPNPPRPTVILR